MMAIVKAISEVCGESGRWVHYGATSNDILDTATGLQLAQLLDLIDTKLRKLLGVLVRRAEETKTLVAVGRTHGQQGYLPRSVSGLPSGQAKEAGILNVSNNCAPGSP